MVLCEEGTPLTIHRTRPGKHGDVRWLVLAEKIGAGQLEVKRILPLEHALRKCYTCIVVVAF